MFVVFFVFAFSGPAGGAAQWLACDPPLENIDTDLTNDVSHYIVSVNGAPLVSVPYNANGSAYQKLWEVTSMSKATFVIHAVNMQARISEPVTFNMAAPPTGCEGLRLVTE